MVRAARKTPGNTRKQEAAERRITATLAQPASDGLDQDDREEWPLAGVGRNPPGGDGLLVGVAGKVLESCPRDWLLIRQAVGRTG